MFLMIEYLNENNDKRIDSKKKNENGYFLKFELGFSDTTIMIEVAERSLPLVENHSGKVRNNLIKILHVNITFQRSN